MITFADITKEMVSLQEKKNKDYGNSFEQTLDEFGLIAGVIRLNDKMNRVKQLCKSQKQEVKDEKIEDTLIDLANYAIMTLSWFKNNNGKI